MRTGLQKVRDVALTVMAVMVSIVCAGLIYIGLAAGSALSDIGKPDSTPTFETTTGQPTENFEPVPSNPSKEDCEGLDPPPNC